MNKIVLTGHLGRDAELKYYGENKNVTKFTLAVNKNFKDIDGEFIKDFRKARGRALKRSNKRIRNKQLNKMAVSMEKIIKEIME